MRLQRMTDFVLEQDKLIRANEINPYVFTMRVTDYALFLKRNLELSMFIPCDEEGNVMEAPDKDDMERYKCAVYGEFSEWYTECFAYQQAKDRLLFEGWLYIHEWRNGHLIARNKNGDYQFNISDYKNVEALNDYMNLTLTNNAIKQIGL